MKHNCELDKLKKTMVDKRTFKKLINTLTHVGSWNWCSRERNSRFSPQVTQNEDSALAR